MYLGGFFSHEDAEEMTRLENVAKMLDSIGIDSSKLEFCRRIVYKFHSRQASTHRDSILIIKKSIPIIR